MLNLSIRDRRALVSEAELAAAIQEGIPALQRAQTGEEQYADSLGWLHVDEWAGEEVLSRIEQLAAQIRETCDAFVLIGVGGSNNAARSVIEALADGQQIIYLDVNPLFDDESGALNADLTGDGTHVYASAYATWSQWLYESMQ